MSQRDKIFAYCERGADAGFWAEPVNAWTNAAFLLAGLAAIWLVRQRPPFERSVDHYLLALLIIAIGVGSGLFHTYAERWSATADVVPIGIFMLVYFAIVMGTFLRLPPGVTLLLTLGFAGLIAIGFQLRCGPGGLLDLQFGGSGGRCFNGSIAYAPAFLVLLLSGLVLRLRGHPAGWSLLLAGFVFLASLIMRTIDPAICARTVFGGYKFGTHFMWHIFNALTLFILTRAVIVHGGHGQPVQQIIPPRR